LYQITIGLMWLIVIAYLTSVKMASENSTESELETLHYLI